MLIRSRLVAASSGKEPQSSGDIQRDREARGRGGDSGGSVLDQRTPAADGPRQRAQTSRGDDCGRGGVSVGAREHRRVEPRDPRLVDQDPRGHRTLRLRGGARVHLPAVLLHARAKAAVRGGRGRSSPRAHADIPGRRGPRAHLRRGHRQPLRCTRAGVSREDLTRVRAASDRVPVRRSGCSASRGAGDLGRRVDEAARAAQAARVPVHQPHSRAAAQSRRRGTRVRLCGSDRHHAHAHGGGEIPRARGSRRHRHCGLRRWQFDRSSVQPGLSVLHSVPVQRTLVPAVLCGVLAGSAAGCDELSAAV